MTSGFFRDLGQVANNDMNEHPIETGAPSKSLYLYLDTIHPHNRKSIIAQTAYIHTLLDLVYLADKWQDEEIEVAALNELRWRNLRSRLRRTLLGRCLRKVLSRVWWVCEDCVGRDGKGRTSKD